MNSCVVIPVYNHPGTIRGVVTDLESLDLTCFLIDDGSDTRTASILDELEEELGWVRVKHLPENRGKGQALSEGFRLALNEGFSHAVVIDADAQHDPGDVPRFLEAADSNPGAVIVGDPVFDETAPASRFYGRKISRYWVWIETLSRDINDPLVGYRCYPIERTLQVIERYQPGLRMEFDPEVLVEYYWEFGEVVNVRTRVTYSTGEGSHFDLVRDNLRISWMHMRLFFGMLKRLPWLLGRRYS